MTALLSLACSPSFSPYPKIPPSWREASPLKKNKAEKLEMTHSWKKALGQSLNSSGVASFLRVATSEHHLALPHLSVPDLRWIDWSELKRLGFLGVVFDKDNTLTAPYSLSLFPALSGSLVRCRTAFPGRVAVFSNSAGLYQYDPDGSEARALEESIGGIHVIRHGLKKPAGSAEEIKNFLGCPASNIVMVGDRCFTDVVFGNRNGFLTVLTEPLCLSMEPFIVKQVRKLEGYFVKRWRNRGLKPAKHILLPEDHLCIQPFLS